MRNKILSLLVLLLTAATGAWAQGEQSESFTTNYYDYVYTGNNFKITVDDCGDSDGFILSEIKYATIEALNGEIITKVEFTKGGYDDINAFSCEVGTTNISGDVATVSGVNQTGLSVSATGPLQIKAVKVYFVTASSAPAVEVTTNAASEGATFTEATFAMPAFDATAEYELVRDMSYGLKALVNNGAERIYVTKVENKFVPKEAITYKLTDVLDQNNQFDLTEGTDYQKVGLHILDGSTWKDVTDESDLKPGTYEMIFEGLGKYDGKVYSQEFLLSNGYELTIDAGEYATFYHNEKVSIEDSDAELYTIASVSTTEAVLSEKMEVAAAETPLLVYNAGSETKTFLLIPTDDEASEALVAAEFRGTLAAKDMPANSSTMDYYVCTGKAFTWVRDAGQIAANRCWLQIGSGNQPAGTRASSRAITRGIGGIDGTTGIDAVENGEVTNEGYYDLNGRKVTTPKRGGIYIHNGKKVIVR